MGRRGSTAGEGLRRLPLTHLEILAARDSTTAAAATELQEGGSDGPETCRRRTQRHRETWSWSWSWASGLSQGLGPNHGFSPSPGFSHGPDPGPKPSSLVLWS